ncbi:MAG: glutathione S-transferase [Sandaracinaceae bacterium]|nr:glutathione S-transferase [Sandaracinaceae bacterium]
MQLYVFPISHFSEKARWACDHHGVAYELVRCVPGPHVATMKRLGVKRTTVPVLTRADGPPIQGSGRIIAHLDGLQPARSLTPADSSWQALEERADRDLGEALRRIFYSAMMTREAVIPLWSQDGPWWSGPLLQLMFPVMKAQITKGYKLYPADVAAAEQAFEAAWTEIEARLGSSPYLLEGRLTRADISVASLLGPLVMPAEHPFPFGKHTLPAGLEPFVARYRGRPLWRYVERLYREDRLQ